MISLISIGMLKVSSLFDVVLAEPLKDVLVAFIKAPSIMCLFSRVETAYSITNGCRPPWIEGYK